MQAITENLMKRVNDGLELMRPYLQADGGDVSLVEVTEDLVVKVKLMGACSSCSMSFQTMKFGLEQSIRRIVPEIKEVINIDDELQFSSPN